MMAAMSMTTNAMAADITPAVQSETPATCKCQALFYIVEVRTKSWTRYSH